MNQKKKMAIILASILALMLVGAAVASKIIASDPYRLPSVALQSLRRRSG